MDSTPTLTPERIPVLDRVRKLLALASNSPNEHEAALAARRAANLMERHEIHEAEVAALDEAAHVRTPEPIDRLRATDTRKRVAWHCALAHGVSRKFHCHYYTNQGGVLFFGRLTAIQTASYTLAFLMREVERLCDAHCAAQWAPTRAYRNAFRLGCAHRIAARLATTDTAAPDGLFPDAPTPTPTPTPTAAPDGLFPDAPTPTPTPTPTEARPSDGALVILQRDREEVNAAWESMTAKWGKGTAIGAVSNYGGYASGRAAGDRANLGGGGRGGLPSGQRVLK